MLMDSAARLSELPTADPARGADGGLASCGNGIPAREAAMPRTPQEIFAHHASALMAGDVEEIVADYAENALLITPVGVFRGRDGVRDAFTRLLGELPEATWDVPTQIFEEDVLLIEWSAVAKSSRVTDGVDTFVFSGGAIRVQTLHYTLDKTD
jgi:hypothetical protein